MPLSALNKFPTDSLKQNQQFWRWKSRTLAQIALRTGFKRN
ncbi:hypothetical protein M595_4823 [Lyngbya aestuarii BL J]|uniref:Uncharacterized protein n=1 Tax=Lyngbya aestuarii BL J TaxID=1348334 RepID=U7QDD4_9CYAN|nr:hypothetical protein M595_4823 [Lyngbya aestuarii BL J]